MRKMARGSGWVLGFFLVFFGLYVFVHDALVVAHIVAPVGDGPFGLIIGPILLVAGVVLILWLRRTRTVEVG
jgi:hypothetical protein